MKTQALIVMATVWGVMLSSGALASPYQHKQASKPAPKAEQPIISSTQLPTYAHKQSPGSREILRFSPLTSGQAYAATPRHKKARLPIPASLVPNPAEAQVPYLQPKAGSQTP